MPGYGCNCHPDRMTEKWDCHIRRDNNYIPPLNRLRRTYKIFCSECDDITYTYCMVHPCKCITCRQKDIWGIICLKNTIKKIYIKRRGIAISEAINHIAPNNKIDTIEEILRGYIY
tara:strand:+ start:146 stop:493 length:348 start_codon:yes stop_codon:yes gene_type:complete